MILGMVVDPPAHLRGPQLDAVVLEQRGHRGVLAAGESPLVFSDHDRVPAPVGVGQRRHQGRGLGGAPTAGCGSPGVEELRDDLPVPGHQDRGLLPPPCPRRDRIPPVLGRHPPVKREPHTSATRLRCPAATGALNPQRQDIAASLRALTRALVECNGSHHNLPLGKLEHTCYSQHLPGTEANPGNTPDHHPDDPSMRPAWRPGLHRRRKITAAIAGPRRAAARPPSRRPAR